MGAKWYRAGEMRVQQAGTVYGPEVVGPEGCKQVVFFSDRRGLLMDFPKAADGARYASLNAGVTEMLCSISATTVA